MIGKLQELGEKLIGLVNRGQGILLLLIRLDWGYQFAQTGWGKLHRLPQVTEFFASLGLPMPGVTAEFVGLVEFLGGILLALGVGSRAVAAILFVNMSVAYVTADHDAVAAFFTDPGKFASADPFTFWFVALLVLVFGPGWVAVDTLAAGWLKKLGK